MMRGQFDTRSSEWFCRRLERMRSLVRHFLFTFAILAPVLVAWEAPAQSFSGFDSSTLPPVSRTLGNWGLKIVVLNVGQADAIVVLAPNGDVVLIDSGKTKSAGNQVVDYLGNETLNGVGDLSSIDLLYTTHYDSDHIGGLPRIVERGIRIRKAFDQGISGKRSMLTSNNNPTIYSKYVTAVGDPNNNQSQDADEPNFVRHKLHYDHLETIGREDQIEIRTVSVRGDTEGTTHDDDLDPENKGSSFDENPGSIALLIRLGEFEFYTAGDQTDDDWKSKPDVEEKLLNSGAIPGGNDIDAIKVSHHGSDTSTSEALVLQMDPEVAVVSTKFTARDKLPKKIVLKQFEDNRAYVLITGDAVNPVDQTYTDSGATNQDDNYTPSDEAVFHNQGNVEILVSPDGSRYTVRGGSFAKTFSAIDADNQH